MPWPVASLAVVLCALALGGCDPFGGDEPVEPTGTGGGGKVDLDGGDRCRSNRIMFHPDYRQALYPVVQRLLREPPVQARPRDALDILREMVKVCRDHRGITYAKAVELAAREVDR